MNNNLENNTIISYHTRGDHTPVKYIWIRRGTLRLMSALAFLVCSLILAACGDEVLYEVDAQEETIAQEDTTYTAEVQLAVEEEEQYIIVHLCGAVVNPGVYELKQGARVVDGVKQAGGFLAEASEEGLNLASPLLDGSRIYIPTTEEIEEAKSQGSLTPDGTYTDAVKVEGNTRDLININTANETALTTLPGIGPSRAKAIIEYRESNGGFKSAEDIKDVSGIGEASFQKLKDYITVN